MKFKRASGILLHPTSLPGPYGIGDLGPAAYRWLDWLAGCGCKLWQVLPLGPTGYGDSPYQCFSAFAGNPYLVSPEVLLEEGLLTREDFSNMPAWDDRKVDFGRLYLWKPALLEKAFRRFTTGPRRLQAEFDSFRTENAAWLDDYALFMALKETHAGGSWGGWPTDLRLREAVALREAHESLSSSALRHSFFQFLFFRQWKALRNYAHEKGLQIIGDIPIFVAYDSSDVWAHPDLFYLDKTGQPTVVAGVPPDYFSPTGQLWGNPLYKWEIHKASGYAWWLERMRATLKLVDILRIDHFRGFAGYWEVPAGKPTAEIGRWVPGPGADLFNAIQAELGSLPILAEDLGVITPDVVALRDQFGFPGMKILQFAFSGPDNPFLPHSYPWECTVYTGTHDNDTTRGWYASAPDEEKEFALRYLHVDGNQFVWDLIRTAWGSVAVFALAPLQDFLELGTEARMNFPSHLGGNWEWRMDPQALSEPLQAKIKELNWLYER
ncbi:MAG: 4-alpha-glucanotransferase [Anaerolineales bacterium]|jgi:4-alpha-glucanotransferase